jgi:hypothetical protein
MVDGMSSSPGPRSVKISDDERGGWSSERPRRPGEPERPPRPVDVSVRGRVLARSDRLRYTPGSLLLIACPDHAARDRFCARVLEERGVLFSRGALRTLLQGRVAPEEVDAKAAALLDATVAKRMAGGQSVVVALEGLDPAEREHYVRMAAPHRRPRHLILAEPARDAVAEEDREVLAALRTALDQGQLGAEGFMTSLRLSGRAIDEVKKIIFAPPPADD